MTDTTATDTARDRDRGVRPIVLVGESLAALAVGDELLVHNLDNRSHQIGPYLVDRGETMQQRFTERTVITGLCTIHPSGRVEIDVIG